MISILIFFKKKYNSIRPACAISAQTGPNTLPPFNILAGNKLIRVDNPFHYYNRIPTEFG